MLLCCSWRLEAHLCPRGWQQVAVQVRLSLPGPAPMTPTETIALIGAALIVTGCLIAVAVLNGPDKGRERK